MGRQLRQGCVSPRGWVMNITQRVVESHQVGSRHRRPRRRLSRISRPPAHCVRALGGLKKSAAGRGSSSSYIQQHVTHSRGGREGAREAVSIAECENHGVGSSVNCLSCWFIMFMAGTVDALALIASSCRTREAVAAVLMSLRSPVGGATRRCVGAVWCVSQRKTVSSRVLSAVSDKRIHHHGNDGAGEWRGASAE